MFLFGKRDGAIDHQFICMAPLVQVVGVQSQ